MSRRKGGRGRSGARGRKGPRGRSRDAHGRPRGRAAGRRAAAAVLSAMVALLAASACGGGPETITREDFIATYVALRGAELDEGGPVISADARDSVLAARGVSEDDLDAFVEAHGRDVVFMADVWNEVDSLMTGRGERR